MRPTRQERVETDKGLALAAMDMARFSAGRWDARRTYEWRVSFGIWALLAAGTLHHFSRLSVIPGVLIVLLYANWLQNVYVRNRADSAFTWTFVNEAQRLLVRHGIARNDQGVLFAVQPPKRVDEPGRRGPYLEAFDHIRQGLLRAYRRSLLSDWAARFQLAVTVGLVIFLYLVSVENVTLASTRMLDDRPARTMFQRDRAPTITLNVSSRR